MAWGPSPRLYLSPAPRVNVLQGSHLLCSLSARPLAALQPLPCSTLLSWGLSVTSGAHL